MGRGEVEEKFNIDGSPRADRHNLDFFIVERKNHHQDLRATGTIPAPSKRTTRSGVFVITLCQLYVLFLLTHTTGDKNKNHPPPNSITKF